MTIFVAGGLSVGVCKSEAMTELSLFTPASQDHHLKTVKI